MKPQEPIRTLLFSTLYPSSVRPGHGIFVETRLRELVQSGYVVSKVVAPVPWFFSTNPKYGDYARMASTPVREHYQGFDVLHPRYFLPPKIGMNVAPLTLAISAKSSIQRLMAEGFDFDVIDAHYYYPDGVAAALLAKYFKKPLAITARGSDINLISKYPIPRHWIRWASQHATASIGVSTALTNVMASLGMPRSSLMTMRNGVDLDRFRPIPRDGLRIQLGWPEQATLICVGNLVENKGQHLAIQALVDLPDFRLVIAGDGPDKPALQALAQQIKVDSRVQFLGRIAQNELARYYSAADILVLPSSREGWPNVLLESMACGTPVVSTNVGGTAEIVISNDAGRLMPQRSAAALAASVVDLWDSLPSRRHVREIAQLFSWQSTVQAQIDLFIQMTAGSKGTNFA
jgi:teichuronic acid biosynthesis glycosyltransferase TuaC